MSKHTTTGNYIWVKTDNGWRKEHIAVWERFNGLLHEGCVVHHLDGDKQNNDISNLDMMTSQKHGSIHKGAMFIGLEWLHTCPYCHEVIYLNDLHDHVEIHLRQYVSKFVRNKLFTEMLGIGKWAIHTKVRYNPRTEYTTVEQWLSPPTKWNFALYNCTPEFGITLHVDCIITGAGCSILTGWRDRKPITTGERAKMYSKKNLGRKWPRKRMS
jgi:hypothetical protein